MRMVQFDTLLTLDRASPEPLHTQLERELRDAVRTGASPRHVPDEILDRREKTVFNDSFTARIDYTELTRWLSNPSWHVPGVDYGILHERLATRDLGVFEYIWAKDLASVHAFLSSFDGTA